MATKALTSLWTDISRGIVIVNLLLTLVVVGSQAAALKIFGIDDMMHLAHIFWRTAPLTVAVAITTFVTLRQVKRDDLNFLSVVLVTAGSLFLATLTANGLGDLRVEKPSAEVSTQGYGAGPMIDYSFRMLYSYYRAYGARDFWSSVIVGGFLGWSWGQVAGRLTAKPHENSAGETPQRKAA